ncbi:hypothetical protein YPPY04_1124, partial [Yersinia pestis PY-04]
MEGEYPPPP